MMYRKQLVKRIISVVLCMGLCALFAFFFPWVCNNYKFPIVNEMPEIFRLGVICSSYFAILAIVATTNIILRHRHSVYKHWPVKKIRFIIPNNKQGDNFRYVDIDTSELPENIVTEVTKIEDMFWKLYCTAKTSKCAFISYLTYDVYLQSLTDDLKNAIDEYIKSGAKNILISKLSIITKNIGTIQQSIDKEKTENDSIAEEVNESTWWIWW